jgi:hypothetical protein
VIRHRFLRVLSGLLVLLAASVGAVPRVPPAGVGATGGDLIQIPLRWCAFEGTTAAANPGRLNEPDTDGVLWRRHERASDRIWIPGARITFRSAITAAILQQANFPVIPDPYPTPGQVGDVVQPVFGEGLELQALRLECNARWDRLTAQFGVPNVGPMAINIRRFVDGGGNPTGTYGIGDWNTYGPSGPSGVNQNCPDLTAVTSADGGRIFVVDVDQLDPNNLGRATDLDGRLVAHELGHLFTSGHGNGRDDDGDGPFDEDCDRDEDRFATPRTVMYPDLFGTTHTVEPLQQDWARTLARKYTGAQIDPPAALVGGDTLSDHRTDEAGDAEASAVDLVEIGMTLNREAGTVRIAHELFGLVPDHAHNQYLAFVDLDADAGTGGAAADLGFPTAFQGAELVTSVVVEPGRTAVPTVWRFDGGGFVDVTNGRVQAAVVAPTGAEAPDPLFDVVGIDILADLVGDISPWVRVQAMALQLADGSEVDALPGGPGEWPTEAAVDLYLVASEFPVCVATPERVVPGERVVIEVAGFGRPDEPVHVVLGDQLIADGALDGEGAAVVEFEVPFEAAEGPRLITVGVDGTALTADCVLQVGG